MFADEDLHRHAAENLAQADALLFGRVASAGAAGARPDWMEKLVSRLEFGSGAVAMRYEPKR
jgi:hypothetical protein